jgi:hypothetical protein
MPSGGASHPATDLHAILIYLFRGCIALEANTVNESSRAILLMREKNPSSISTAARVPRGSHIILTYAKQMVWNKIVVSDGWMSVATDDFRSRPPQNIDPTKTIVSQTTLYKQLEQ